MLANGLRLLGISAPNRI
ncbi:hypothetical protein [Streptomyces sp. RTd22]|nr:hypothetical protein [Streptomyces sp. RTd22]